MREERVEGGKCFFFWPVGELILCAADEYIGWFPYGDMKVLCDKI